MVICAGFCPDSGCLRIFNSETDETKSFTANKCHPKKVEDIFQLFKFIRFCVTKESIGFFCISMTSYYTNEYRKKFIEIAKENAVRNIRIIGVEQAYLCGAIAELSMSSPKMNDEIWIFFIFENLIYCWIWKFNAKNGWEIQNFLKQERTTENAIHKFPTMEDFQKLKEKMEIGNEIPYIYVFYGNHNLNLSEFEMIFLHFQKIIFQKNYHFAKGILNYARFMFGQKIFLKYKSESLLPYTIQIKKRNDTEIFCVSFNHVLPFFKTTTIDLANNERLKVNEGYAITSAVSIKETGKYQIGLNIDVNGIIMINLQPIDSFVDVEVEDTTTSFTIPIKLNNYNSSLNAIGIDLGTTECGAAVIRRNGPDSAVLDVIKNSRTMPSFIAFDEEEPKFGQIVVDRMRFKSQYSLYDVKRILGKKIDEIILDRLWPFRIISSSFENNVQIEIETLNGKDFKTCEEITANLIFHIKTTFEIYQKKELFEAVITIPADFSDRQKEATLKAAELAGFQTVHFLPEPIAAAFAYFTEMKISENSNILICDCGGGTVNICISKITSKKLNILNFEEDSQLGGRDFDTILFTHFCAILKHKFGIDVMKTNKKFLLKQKCQNIKHTLSAQIEDWLDVSDFDSESNEIIKISRDEFEEMSINLFLKITSVICRAVSNANLDRSQIDFVFQVGGGCRMPMIKDMLKEIFPDSKHECHPYPDLVVAHGAALYAYHLKLKEQQITTHKNINFESAVNNLNRKSPLFQKNKNFSLKLIGNSRLI